MHFILLHFRVRSVRLILSSGDITSLPSLFLELIIYSCAAMILWIWQSPCYQISRLNFNGTEQWHSDPEVTVISSSTVSLATHTSLVWILKEKRWWSEIMLSVSMIKLFFKFYFPVACSLMSLSERQQDMFSQELRYSTFKLKRWLFWYTSLRKYVLHITE